MLFNLKIFDTYILSPCIGLTKSKLANTFSEAVQPKVLEGRR